MSAIFGILRFDGADAAAGDMERMGERLAHRGPDGRAFAVDGQAGVGHCLMRVNQEDVFEAQPLRDGNLLLVADARIDNREELAEAFGVGAAELREMPDSALVLRACKKWGDDAADHLLGDFAFALWDGDARRLLLGRDPMGQRSVHYFAGKNFFAFATEVKALWALTEVPRRLSEAQVGRYLLMDRRYRAEETLFEGIWNVPGGTTLAVNSDAKLTKRRYWEFHADPAHVGRDESYYIETYRRIFTEAVACRVRRLIAPPALCLSAGYDSGGIAGLCGPTLTERGMKLIAVSSVMAEGYNGPLLSAREWVERCRRDMPHLEVRYFVRGEENVFTSLEATCAAADGFPKPDFYVTDALFREAARAGARLVMDGHAGDATINPRVGNGLTYFLRTGRWRRFGAELRAHRRLSGQSLGRTLRDVMRKLTPPWVRRSWRAVRRRFKPVWHDKGIAPELARRLIESGDVEVRDILGWTWDNPEMRELVVLSLNAWTARYRTSEANEAAAHGLELTRPLADRRVVEFGLAIPEELYVKDGVRRYLGTRALADVYPREFQTRRPRQDVLDPAVDEMFRGARPQVKAELEQMAARPEMRRYFDCEKMMRDLEDAPESYRASRFDLRVFMAAAYVIWFEGRN